MCISPITLRKVLICMHWGWEPGKDAFWLRPTHVVVAAPRKCINIYEKGTKKSRHLCLPFSICSSFYKFNFGATFGGIDITTVTSRQKCTYLMFSCNWESWCWFLLSEIVIFSTFFNITFFFSLPMERHLISSFFSLAVSDFSFFERYKDPLFFLKSKDQPVSIATTVPIWSSIFFIHETVFCKTDLLSSVQWANSHTPRGGISSLGVGGNFQKSNTATQVSATYL